jgi:hypothetical protein
MFSQLDLLIEVLVTVDEKLRLGAQNVADKGIEAHMNFLAAINLIKRYPY